MYVGGEFTNIGGNMRNHIAALNATSGNATAWNPGANGTVSALAVNKTNIYAGGNFDSIGGQNHKYIAALDASTGNATSWDPNSNNYVGTLAVSGTTVYASGSFTVIGGQNRNFIAALDSATGDAKAWNPSASYNIYSLVVNGETVYVGGAFNSIGQATGHPSFAQFGDFDTTPVVPPKSFHARDQIIPKTYSFNISGSNRIINYSLPKAEYVSLRLYSLCGKLQSELVNSLNQAGCYSIKQSELTAAGIYLAVFKAGDFYKRKLMNITR